MRYRLFVIVLSIATLVLFFFVLDHELDELEADMDQMTRIIEQIKRSLEAME